MNLIEELPKPLSILDVGGTQDYWEKMDFVKDEDINVVLLNITPIPTKYSNFKSVIGNATDLVRFSREAIR